MGYSWAAVGGPDGTKKLPKCTSSAPFEKVRRYRDFDVKPGISLTRPTDHAGSRQSGVGRAPASPPTNHPSPPHERPSPTARRKGPPSRTMHRAPAHGSVDHARRDRADHSQTGASHAPPFHLHPSRRPWAPRSSRSAESRAPRPRPHRQPRAPARGRRPDGTAQLDRRPGTTGHRHPRRPSGHQGPERPRGRARHHQDQPLHGAPEVRRLGRGPRGLPADRREGRTVSAVITKADGGLTGAVGKRIGVTVHDQGKHDRFGYSWAMVGIRTTCRTTCPSA